MTKEDILAKYHTGLENQRLDTELDIDINKHKIHEADIWKGNFRRWYIEKQIS